MPDLTVSAAAATPGKWRTIDSAPTDGTLFLACNLDQPTFGSWPMYRRVRHALDDSGTMVTTDLGGWAKIGDLQPDWGEGHGVGPEPHVSIAPDDLNKSVRYGWTPFQTPGSPAEKREGERLIGTIGHVSHGRAELGALITSALTVQPAPPSIAEPMAWRCFHCSDVFTTPWEARDHFGHTEDATPACAFKGSEIGLVKALREAEKDASDAWFALQNEGTTTAKAFRAMQGRHQRQLTVMEQLGYDRAVADARAHPGEIGLAHPSDGAEMPEVALARYIEILRAEEGDVVTIACDNPETWAADKRVAIDCNGAWTDFEDRRFEGETVLQCLAKAVSARTALTPAPQATGADRKEVAVGPQESGGVTANG